MQTKGIILAGGSGTRLYPSTAVMSKQLQLVYDKPMIYYPIATLMIAGIRDILLISTPADLPNFRKLLGTGEQFGLNISYQVQEKPNGIAQAFVIAKDFIGSDQVCLILGDNIFYGDMSFLREALKDNQGGFIFGYEVQNPGEFGVITIDKKNNIKKIEEKPKSPNSNYAIPGLYIFDNRVVEIAQKLKPSIRNEYEITDIHKYYWKEGKLNFKIIDRGMAWLDTGTPSSIMEAGMFIQAIEKRQGRKIACLEEIALQNKFVSVKEMTILMNKLPECSYKDYCLRILKEFSVK